MYVQRRKRYNRDSVSIGRFASEESDTEYTVSVGRRAGYANQEQYAIAVGDRAGEETQGLNAIAVGKRAGNTSQATNTVAIGSFAGEITQAANAIAIGDTAGQTTQSKNAMAIGSFAGQTTQGEYAIAIGNKAGQTTQGKYSIAIGSMAGVEVQPDYSIVISTSETDIKPTKKGLYVDPIRKFDDRTTRPVTVKEGNILSYNYLNDTAKATKEVVTGFPRLPAYPNDAEVLLAFTAAKAAAGDTGAPLGVEDNGTLYFDTTKKKVKVWVDTRWLILLDEVSYTNIRALLPALPAL